VIPGGLIDYIKLAYSAGADILWLVYSCTTGLSFPR